MDALQTAAQNGNTGCVKVLLEHSTECFGSIDGILHARLRLKETAKEHGLG